MLQSTTHFWNSSPSAAAFWMLAVAGWPAIASRAEEPSAALTAGQRESLQNEAFQKSIVPLLKQHCFDCHGPRKATGGLALHRFSNVADVRGARRAWESVLQMLEGNLMPPEGRPSLPVADRQKLQAWIESTLFHLDCELPRDPGRVTVRRLNRQEYNNTVQELLGVDLRPADQFPSDDVGNGFDNMGDVLSLPPLLLEKYLQAAEELAAAAITAPEDRDTRPRRKSGRQLSTDTGQLSDDRYVLASSGEVRANFAVAADGEYSFELRASGDQAGPDPARAEVLVDGKSIRVFDVEARPDAPRVYALKLPLASGLRRFAVRFVNDYYQPKHPDPKLRGDRNLWVDEISLAGPAAPAERDLPRFQRAVLQVRPGDGRSVAQAAAACLLPVLERAFRRPVTADDTAPYVRLVELAAGRGESFERGMQVALTAVLVSPQFLFRVEQDPDPHDNTNIHPVTEYELASRLSYFLWSSMPDQELFLLARQGALREPAVLRQQIRRMLRDPKSRTLSDNFAAQWLNLRNLDDVTPDPDKFAGFDSALRDAMKQETLLFFQAMVSENRSILELLTADFTFVNQRLAEHYGMADVQGDTFRRVAVAPRRRAGVLTHGSVLTLTSNPDRTSPVKRGKWILENLLGAPPPDPPPDVPELAATQQASPTASLRQQMELHRKSPNCAVCHVQMDALGFGLENFDAVGRWRDQDGGQPIDSAGELPLDSAPAGDNNQQDNNQKNAAVAEFSGAAELAGVLSRKPDQISRCVAEKMLRFALGRGLEYYDRCSVDEIVKQLRDNDYRMHTLVQAIVTSEPFLLRRGEAKSE